MRTLVRLAIYINWGIVLFTAVFMYKQRFYWSFLWLGLSLLHIYILAYSEFSNDLISNYLKTKSRRYRRKSSKSRRRSSSE
ncbi:MAG: hypothetical protein H8D46_01915 [FCB group bacterium]|nr:hypothetical protein [FCB group bacterium]